MVTTLPQSVSREALENLATELRRILSAMHRTGTAGSTARDSEKVKAQFEAMYSSTRDYYRLTKLFLIAQEGLESGGRSEDSDQLASLALYLRHRFRIMEHDLWNRLALTWHDFNSRHFKTFTSIFDNEAIIDSKNLNVEIGIVTVLEHEYQSVVRRLDRIVLCSNDKTFGSAILDRLRPEDDLKVYAEEKGGVGWSVGYLGKVQVLVICTGSVGEETTRRAIDRVREILKLTSPKRGWLVVGVCAGTDRGWPIGTVLISKHQILGLKRPKSSKYTIDKKDVVRPMLMPESKGGVFAVKALFRALPASVNGIQIAPPEQVLVRGVKYACTPHVVNETIDKKRILKTLRDSGLVGPDEAIGVEMEALGAIVSMDDPLGVIKGVCDYGDTGKSQWPEDLKNFYQLYAAETAAEYVAQAIRSSVTKFKPAHEAE